MTLGLVIALTAYAFLTKRDFTMLGGIMTVVIISLLMFGLLAYFW